MNLEEKIGQMLMLGFRGTELDDTHPFTADLAAGRIGSVVLFDYDVLTQRYGRNIDSASQVVSLVADLQHRSRTPLLVTLDQEGGHVCRLKSEQGFAPLPSARSLGQGTAHATRKAAGIAAAELAALGINLNLAPCVDLDVYPANPIIGAKERSFSADASTVAEHAAAFIEAHQAHGVACCLKHFPGHGSSRDDSHLDMVDVSRTWSETELEPYRRLCASGLVDAVMTAHVFNDGIDPDFPATLSQRAINGVLRQDLGFDGVVVSDDLQMGAIARHYGLETALRRAVEAGVDILALANNTLYEEGIAARAVDLLCGMVRGGVLNEARIDRSVERIQRLKRSL